MTNPTQPHCNKYYVHKLRPRPYSSIETVAAEALYRVCIDTIASTPDDQRAELTSVIDSISKKNKHAVDRVQVILLKETTFEDRMSALGAYNYFLAEELTEDSIERLFKAYVERFFHCNGPTNPRFGLNKLVADLVSGLVIFSKSGEINRAGIYTALRLLSNEEFASYLEPNTATHMRLVLTALKDKPDFFAMFRQAFIPKNFNPYNELHRLERGIEMPEIICTASIRAAILDVYLFPLEKGTSAAHERYREQMTRSPETLFPIFAGILTRGILGSRALDNNLISEICARTVVGLHDKVILEESMESLPIQNASIISDQQVQEEQFPETLEKLSRGNSGFMIAYCCYQRSALQQAALLALE